MFSQRTRNASGRVQDRNTVNFNSRIHLLEIHVFQKFLPETTSRLTCVTRSRLNAAHVILKKKEADRQYEDRSYENACPMKQALFTENVNSSNSFRNKIILNYVAQYKSERSNSLYIYIFNILYIFNISL